MTSRACPTCKRTMTITPGANGELYCARTSYDDYAGDWACRMMGRMLVAEAEVDTLRRAVKGLTKIAESQDTAFNRRNAVVSLFES